MFFGITWNEYLRSIGPENIIGSMIMGDIATVKEQCSTGKSGSFFYYTPDNRFMIKTISHSEFYLLKQIIKTYFQHLLHYPQTLITRYYGLHKIKYKRDNGGIQRVYFIVMANVFNTSRMISVRYDLKGSKHGRNTRRKPDEKVDPAIALKDCDFDHDGIKIDLPENVKEALLKQIQIDVSLFQHLEINDYSVLLGVTELEHGAKEGNLLHLQHDKDSLKTTTGATFDVKVAQVLSPNYGKFPVIDEQRFKSSFFECIDGGMLSKDKSKLYLVGIIDILTFYGAKKQMEYTFKSLVHG